MKKFMRIYLDDERETPDGWIHTYWTEEVIALQKNDGVVEISLGTVL
jgi:hypothetical protein